MAGKGTFIRLNYTGKEKESGQIFDTTIESVAHESGVPHHHGTMKPIVICLGEGHVLPGLDVKLEGLGIGKHTIELKAEEAFGKKDAKLMRLIPTKLFHKEQINPMPGLPVTVDDKQGVIRAASGGRVIVDFNHPLAGQDVIYEVEILEEVHDKKEQVEAILHIRQLPFSAVVVHENKAEITLQFPLPKEIADALESDIRNAAKLSEVKFSEEKKDAKAGAPEVKESKAEKKE